MSVRAFRWAKEVSLIPGREKSILLNLADRHNEEKGYAWPSMQRIADDTGWDRRTVLRGIKGLKKLGLIKVYRQVYVHDGSFGPNRYYFPSLGPVPPMGSTFEVGGGFDASGTFEPDDTESQGGV